MPYFKDDKNNLHFLEDGVDPDYVDGFPVSFEKISDDEANLIISSIPTQEIPLIQDPILKLKYFLASNPDVESLLK